MKQSEFKRWLAAQGVTFKEGAGHTKAYYQGRQTTVPRHPSKEIDPDFADRIKKQLGLK